MELHHNNRNVADSQPEVSVEVRRLTYDDADAYIDLLRQEDERLSGAKSKLGLYALYKGSPDVLRDRLAQGENRNGIWVDGELAGGIDTLPGSKPGRKEVAYWLKKTATRRGIGKEALRQEVERADAEGVDLEAHVEQDNISSMTVLESNGFRERPLQIRGQTDYLRLAKKPKANSEIDAQEHK